MHDSCYKIDIISCISIALHLKSCFLRDHSSKSTWSFTAPFSLSSASYWLVSQPRTRQHSPPYVCLRYLFFRVVFLLTQFLLQRAETPPTNSAKFCDAANFGDPCDIIPADRKCHNLGPDLVKKVSSLQMMGDKTRCSLFVYVVPGILVAATKVLNRDIWKL
jgi:hypothetical protein